jgi:hypothetical protein
MVTSFLYLSITSLKTVITLRYYKLFIEVVSLYTRYVLEDSSPQGLTTIYNITWLSLFSNLETYKFAETSSIGLRYVVRLIVNYELK